MQFKKVLIILLVFTLSISVLAGCGNGEQEDVNTSEESELDAIKEKGKIVLGTSADYPPYEFHAFIDGEDKIVGFDMELGRYIAEELGVELEIKEMDFGNLIGGLSSGMVDMVIAGMSPDPEREKEVNFSDVYYKATHGVLIRKDSEDLIKAEEDLEGKKLGVQMGTIQEQIGEEIKDASLTILPVTNNLIMELETERIDGIIMEKPVAEAYAKSNPDLMVVEDIEIIDDVGGSAIAIKKGNDELTEAINEILKKVEEEGLMEKWVVEANEIQEEAGIEE